MVSSFRRVLGLTGASRPQDQYNFINGFFHWHHVSDLERNQRAKSHRRSSELHLQATIPALNFRAARKSSLRATKAGSLSDAFARELLHLRVVFCRIAD